MVKSMDTYMISVSCSLILTAHLTGVFASFEFPSTKHIIVHQTSISITTVTHPCINDVHTHFHQILRDNTFKKKKKQKNVIVSFPWQYNTPQ